MTIRLILLLMALALLGASCGRTPAECVQLCEQIHKWTVQCKAPLLSLETCKSSYWRNDGINTTAVGCWNTLMEWTPNLAAELDCTKPPPRLR